jgi:hypothetical protein
MAIHLRSREKKDPTRAAADDAAVPMAQNTRGKEKKVNLLDDSLQVQAADLKTSTKHPITIKTRIYSQQTI